MTLVATPEATCKTCGKGFIRARSMQAVCSFRCAAKHVKEVKQQEKDETRARRMAMKRRADWLKEAQQAFNAYIRARDEAAGHPCISCGRMDRGNWDAGHYLTVGARPELRFNADNVHRQCIPCNQHLHGNVAMYRIGLVARIGLERVEALEGPHPPAKWSVDELQTMKAAYRLMTKQIKEGRA